MMQEYDITVFLYSKTAKNSFVSGKLFSIYLNLFQSSIRINTNENF